jgi:hypothetical protein
MQLKKYIIVFSFFVKIYFNQEVKETKGVNIIKENKNTKSKSQTTNNKDDNNLNINIKNSNKENIKKPKYDYSNFDTKKEMNFRLKNVEIESENKTINENIIKTMILIVKSDFENLPSKVLNDLIEKNIPVETVEVYLDEYDPNFFHLKLIIKNFYTFSEIKQSVTHSMEKAPDIENQLQQMMQFNIANDSMLKNGALYLLPIGKNENPFAEVLIKKKKSVLEVSLNYLIKFTNKIQNLQVYITEPQSSINDSLLHKVSDTSDKYYKILYNKEMEKAVCMEPSNFVIDLLDWFMDVLSLNYSITTENYKINSLKDGNIDLQKTGMEAGIDKIAVSSRHFIIHKNSKVSAIVFLEPGKKHKQGEVFILVDKLSNVDIDKIREIEEEIRKEQKHSNEFFSYKIPKKILKETGSSHDVRVDFMTEDNLTIIKKFIIEPAALSYNIERVFIDSYEIEKYPIYHSLCCQAGGPFFQPAADKDKEFFSAESEKQVVLKVQSTENHGKIISYTRDAPEHILKKIFKIFDVTFFGGEKKIGIKHKIKRYYGTGAWEVSGILFPKKSLPSWHPLYSILKNHLVSTGMSQFLYKIPFLYEGLSFLKKSLPFFPELNKFIGEIPLSLDSKLDFKYLNYRSNISFLFGFNFYLIPYDIIKNIMERKKILEWFLSPDENRSFGSTIKSHFTMEKKIAKGLKGSISVSYNFLENFKHENIKQEDGIENLKSKITVSPLISYKKINKKNISYYLESSSDISWSSKNNIEWDSLSIKTIGGTSIGPRESLLINTSLNYIKDANLDKSNPDILPYCFLEKVKEKNVNTKHLFLFKILPEIVKEILNIMILNFKIRVDVRFFIEITRKVSTKDNKINISDGNISIGIKIAVQTPWFSIALINVIPIGNSYNNNSIQLIKDNTQFLLI